MNSARYDPILAVVAAMGASLVILEGLTSAGHRVDGSDHGGLSSRIKESMNMAHAEAAIKESVGKVQHSAGKVAGQALKQVGHWRGRPQPRLKGVRKELEGVVALVDKEGGAALSSIEGWARKNPWSFGAIAFGVGGAIAAAVALSQRAPQPAAQPKRLVRANDPISRIILTIEDGLDAVLEFIADVRTSLGLD